MRRLAALALAASLLVSACTAGGGSGSGSGGGAADGGGDEGDRWAGLPAVEGPEPSREVVAFYYAWYGNPDIDSAWIHWDGSRSLPPDTLATDFYPTLGAYSSSDPAVVAQHMAWLRQAGVGVIAVSYWRFETSDATLDLIFDTAAHYGIQVALHVEPYPGRSPATLAAEVERLLDRYAEHPALYRLEAESPWLEGVRPRPLVFLWATNVDEAEGRELAMSEWAVATDAIHARSDAFVVHCPCGGRFAEGVVEGHFDGAYNYADIDLQGGEVFGWARGLPRDALYIPSILPGMSQTAIGGGPELVLDRGDGALYREQFEAALTTGVRPTLLSITSFNEWHEGTQIEPTEADHTSSDPAREWLDYGGLPPDGYLTLTAELVAEYLGWDWAAGAPLDARLVVETTSDITFVRFEGARLVAPDEVRRSAGIASAAWEAEQLFLTQPLARAEGGRSVTVVYDIGLLDLTDAGLTVAIGRGHIGSTTVTLQVQRDGRWVQVASFTWSGIVDGDNMATYEVPRDRLV